MARAEKLGTSDDPKWGSRRGKPKDIGKISINDPYIPVEDIADSSLNPEEAMIAEQANGVFEPVREESPMDDSDIEVVYANSTVPNGQSDLKLKHLDDIIDEHDDEPKQLGSYAAAHRDESKSWLRKENEKNCD